MNGFPSPDWIIQVPIAHRGLHDLDQGKPENTLAAAEAAITSGYAIEVDLHPSRDNVPMVFHDFKLDRLTPDFHSIRERSAAELSSLSIAESDQLIPTLEQLLNLVDGQVGLILELKSLANEDREFAEAVARVLSNYDGPVAVMSFNHWLLRDFRRTEIDAPLGLVAEGDDSLFDTHHAIDRELRFEFLSYSVRDLPNRFVADFKASNRPVITWTVRSVETARQIAPYIDQITFEKFLPEL